jgi:hypothetical protein
MATFYKGNTPIPATPSVGGSTIERTMLGANALINGFEVGQDLGYGIVYKSFGGGSAMVVAKNDLTIGVIPPNLYSWVNQGGCGVNADSLTDGFANMLILYNASSIVGGECSYRVGYDPYEELYVTGSLYEGTTGWYVPAKNELQEVYDSEVIKYTYTSGDGGRYFSSTSATDNSKGQMLAFGDGTWSDSAGVSSEEARIRLIKRV